MKLIEELLPTQRQSKLTGSDLIAAVKSLKLTRDTAVQIVTLDNVLSKVVKDAKEYLLSLPTAPSGSFRDESTGLIVQYSFAERKTITNPRIEELKQLIKEEEQKVLRGESEGEVTITPYTRWTLVK